MQIKLDSVVKSGIKTRFASNKKRGCLLVLSATWSVVSLVGILGGTIVSGMLGDDRLFQFAT